MQLNQGVTPNAKDKAILQYLLYFRQCITVQQDLKYKTLFGHNDRDISLKADSENWMGWDNSNTLFSHLRDKEQLHNASVCFHVMNWKQ